MKKTCLYILRWECLPDSFSLIPVMIMIIFHNFGTKLHWFHEAFRLPICIVKRGRPIYRSADIYNFLIYRHRPISVFSNADLKSARCGQPCVIGAVDVLLLHVKDPKPKLLEDSTTVLGDKGRLKFWYFKVLWPCIYYILLVNYEVLLHSVKEKTNNIALSWTGIMLQLVEGLLTCS